MLDYVLYICYILPPFQILRRHVFSRYIAFRTHLDMHHVYLNAYQKLYISRKATMTYNLEMRGGIIQLQLYDIMHAKY